MRISDWSSDVCSSDLGRPMRNGAAGPGTSESLAHIHIPVARDRRMERAHISEGTRIDRRLRIGNVAHADTQLGAVGETALEIVLHIQAGGGVGLDLQILAVDRRSEDRRVWQEWVSTCNSWGWPSHKKK